MLAVMLAILNNYNWNTAVVVVDDDDDDDDDEHRCDCIVTHVDYGFDCDDSEKNLVKNWIRRLWRCSVGVYFAKMQLECLLPWGSTLASGFELLAPFGTLVGFDTSLCQETVADCHIVVKYIQLHVALLQQVEGHAWKSETRSNKRVFNYICMCCNQEFTRNLYRSIIFYQEYNEYTYITMRIYIYIIIDYTYNMYHI